MFAAQQVCRCVATCGGGGGGERVPAAAPAAARAAALLAAPRPGGPAGVHGGT
jgi:hypothetical protein